MRGLKDNDRAWRALLAVLVQVHMLLPASFQSKQSASSVELYHAFLQRRCSSLWRTPWRFSPHLGSDRTPSWSGSWRMGPANGACCARRCSGVMSCSLCLMCPTLSIQAVLLHGLTCLLSCCAAGVRSWHPSKQPRPLMCAAKVMPSARSWTSIAPSSSSVLPLLLPLKSSA